MHATIIATNIESCVLAAKQYSICWAINMIVVVKVVAEDDICMQY